MRAAHPVVGPEGKLSSALALRRTPASSALRTSTTSGCGTSRTSTTRRGRTSCYRRELRLAGRACGREPYGARLDGRVRPLRHADRARAGDPRRRQVPASVLRWNPDGSELVARASAVRSGKAFAPDGRLFVVDHGIDERGHRTHLRRHGRPVRGARGRVVRVARLRGRDPSLDDRHWAGAAAAASRSSASTEAVTAEAVRDVRAPLRRQRHHLLPRRRVRARGRRVRVRDATSTRTRRGSRRRPATSSSASTCGRARSTTSPSSASRAARRSCRTTASSDRRTASSARTARYVTDWGEIDIAPEAGGVRMQIGSGTPWRTCRTGGRRVRERDRPRPWEKDRERERRAGERTVERAERSS